METDKGKKGKLAALAFMLLLLTTCGTACVHVGTSKAAPQQTVLDMDAAYPDSVQYYFAQAQYGIGDAYVKMAHFYLDGTLGKPNLLKVMQMGFMAEEYKAIPGMEALFKDVPDSDPTKMAFEAIEMLEHTDDKEVLNAKARELLDKGNPDGFLLQAIMQWAEGNRAKAVAFCEKSIEEGSTIADVFKDMILGGEYNKDYSPETLLKIADRFPFSYRLLGNYYAHIPNDSASDIPLARQYYLKACDHACLGRREASWVLETIYVLGYPPVDSLTEKRLWSLCRNEVNDSVVYLP